MPSRRNSQQISTSDGRSEKRPNFTSHHSHHIISTPSQTISRCCCANGNHKGRKERGKRVVIFLQLKIVDENKSQVQARKRARRMSSETLVEDLFLSWWDSDSVCNVPLGFCWIFQGKGDTVYWHQKKKEEKKKRQRCDDIMVRTRKQTTIFWVGSRS